MSLQAKAQEKIQSLEAVIEDLELEYKSDVGKLKQKIQSLEAEIEAYKKIKNIKLRADNIRLQQEIDALKSQSVQKWIPVSEMEKLVDYCRADSYWTPEKDTVVIDFINLAKSVVAEQKITLPAKEDEK